MLLNTFKFEVKYSDFQVSLYLSQRKVLSHWVQNNKSKAPVASTDSSETKCDWCVIKRLLRKKKYYSLTGKESGLTIFKKLMLSLSEKLVPQSCELFRKWEKFNKIHILFFWEFFLRDFLGSKSNIISHDMSASHPLCLYMQKIL